jgi:hypothetical protein
LPPDPAGVGFGADNVGRSFLSTVHLKVCLIFIVQGGEVRRRCIGNNQIHGTHVAGSFFDDRSASGQGLESITMVKSFDVVEDLFRADATFLLDPHTVELTVEYKYPLTVEKRHVIFNRNSLISKSASGMSDKQSSGAEL